jgi:hypothetical protein
VAKYFFSRNDMKVLRNANTIATTAAILIPVQCTVQKLLFEEIKKKLCIVYCIL